MKIGSMMNRVFYLRWFAITAVQLCFSPADCSELASLRKSLTEQTAGPAVRMYEVDNLQVVIDNGYVRLSLSKPGGYVLGISYNGLETIDNMLEARNAYDDRGYWDVVWFEQQSESTAAKVEGTEYSVVVSNDDEVEVSFSSTRSSSMNGSQVPFNVDRRYIMRRGVSGIHTYAIFERTKEFPAMEVDQIRIVFKPQRDRYTYMAISDDRQRYMPTSEDRATGQPLAYPEAVLLTNPSNPLFKGEVDDKYQYSMDNKDNNVHGWMDLRPNCNATSGFWMITPSNEFRGGGPLKQDLTSHVGPVILNTFVSAHYSGNNETMVFQNGETFKKVYGPFLIYFNSATPSQATSKNISDLLWSDAVEKMKAETQNWPYSFPQSKGYFTSKQRGSVSGRLLVQDRHINAGRVIFANNAYVGLALPGEPGSWQGENKGYQFWTQTDENGYFTIKNIVPGDYNLYGWVPGIFGDYKYNEIISITEGKVINLGSSLIFSPPRNGPTIWEIGIPDRLAAEFFVPDPNITLENRLYVGKPKYKFRQYGLWERYTELYPKEDLIFTVGVSDYRKDWFYAQVTRRLVNGAYYPTTWQVVFDLPFVIEGNYTLQMGLASASESILEVRVNNPNVDAAPFMTSFIGKDSAIARHGIHGFYRQYNIELPSQLFAKGKNTVYLKQSNAPTAFQGVMYDYLRLESPESTSRT